MKFQPSRSQQRAICHKDGPLLVLAGPGSGKTAVITQRIAHLITHHRIPPDQILVITFTKAAALQLGRRFTHLINPLQQMHAASQVTIKTFHSLFYMILRHTFPNTLPKIASGAQTRAAAEGLLSEKAGAYLSPGLLQDFLKAVSEIKSGIYDFHKTGQSFSAERLQLLFGAYEDRMRKSGLMDMDDILLKTKELLRSDDGTRSFWQQKYPYIMIDEFQDISPLQFECMVLLAGKTQNLFAVGDDDQAIYHFRGARPELMLNFHHYFPGAGQVLLETNYRCPRTVTEAAGRVISHNRQRYDKKIVPFAEGGEDILVKSFETAQAEAVYAAECAKAHIAAGRPPKEFAVLFRNNRQAALLTGELVLRKIPFLMKEQGRDIFSHWLVKDMLAYVKIAEGRASVQEFFRVMNRPVRYLGREQILNALPKHAGAVSLEQLQKAMSAYPHAAEALSGWQLHSRMLRTLPPYGGVQYIRKVMGYDAFLREYAEKTGSGMDTFTDILDEFSDSVRALSGWAQYGTFLKEREMLQRKEQAKDDAQAVLLSTMHGSKGLEFESVIILDVNEGVTPYGRMGIIENLEEERRLFYVAMTRAKKKLQLLYVSNEDKKLQPSRFLGEAFPCKKRINC